MKPEPAPPGLALRTLALASLAAMLEGIEPAPPSAVLALLQQARGALGRQAWTALLPASLAQPGADAFEQRLRAVAAQEGLSDTELLALTLLASAQAEPAVARLVAVLQGEAEAALPTLGLLATWLAPLHGGRSELALLSLLQGPGARAGVWAVDEAEAPALARLRLPLALLDWLWRGSAAPLASDALPALAPSQVQALAPALARLRAGQPLALVAVAPQDGEAAAQALGQALQRPLLALPLQGPWPEGWALLARLGAWLPVAQGASAQPVPQRGTPWLWLDAEDLSPLPRLHLPLPTAAERDAMWQREGWGEPEALARRWRGGSVALARAAEGARWRAQARAAAAPEPADLLQVQAEAAREALAGLAQVQAWPLAPQLVLPLATQERLLQLRARCRVREQLHDAAQRRERVAVVALFAGPSGTGKSLAAAWLAAELGLPLAVVDLALLSSKWIGETEKNLARLFAVAESQSVLLLFDEADALFGARTDAHSANDRFANQQTNYLLSRLESFDGLALLTSNARQRLDPAFARRLDAVIDFRLPEPPERRALWALHLGESVPAAWLDRLAGLVDLPGGHVRTVALGARAMALDAARPLQPTDLLRALQAEYAKLGRSAPTELEAPWPA